VAVLGLEMFLEGQEAQEVAETLQHLGQPVQETQTQAQVVGPPTQEPQALVVQEL
jgi:hypothetical protein